MDQLIFVESFPAGELKFFTSLLHPDLTSSDTILQDEKGRSRYVGWMNTTYQYADLTGQEDYDCSKPIPLHVTSEHRPVSFNTWEGLLEKINLPNSKCKRVALMFTELDSFLYTLWWFSSRELYDLPNEMDDNKYKQLFERFANYYKSGTCMSTLNTEYIQLDAVNLMLSNQWSVLKEVAEDICNHKIDYREFQNLKSDWIKHRYKPFMKWRESYENENVISDIYRLFDETGYNKVKKD